MKSTEEDVVSCENYMRIVAETNRVKRLHPLDVRNQFNAVFTAYLQAYGIEGVFQRMNGRSVATILQEFQGFQEKQPIVTGERDGVKYALYEAEGEAPDSPAG